MDAQEQFFEWSGQEFLAFLPAELVCITIWENIITVTRKPKEIVVSIPLRILGNPQRILTSENTYVGPVPLDWVAWRILEIKDETY